MCPKNEITPCQLRIGLFMLLQQTLILTLFLIVVSRTLAHEAIPKMNFLEKDILSNLFVTQMKSFRV